MIVAPFPANEAQRQSALNSYHILDTATDPRFDDLTHLTAKILETPIAYISFIDAHRQWFKSSVGLAATEAPREFAFCAHAILQSTAMIVPDAWLDPRFVNNPFVRGEPHIRFYAAVALIDSAGYALGTLSVIDHVARAITRVQLLALQKLGTQVLGQLEHRREHQTAAANPRPGPRPAPGISTAADAAPTTDAHPFEGLRVLVAEDNIVSQLNIRKLLNQLGCEPTLVESGIAAVNAWNSKSFDIVMMDCKMPGIDGYEATRRIRTASKPGVRVPIIALADRLSGAERDIAILAGTDDFLMKPIVADDLFTALSRARFQRARPSTAAPTASATSTPATQDHATTPAKS